MQPWTAQQLRSMPGQTPEQYDMRINPQNYQQQQRQNRQQLQHQLRLRPLQQQVLLDAEIEGNPLNAIDEGGYRRKRRTKRRGTKRRGTKRRRTKRRRKRSRRAKRGGCGDC